MQIGENMMLQWQEKDERKIAEKERDYHALGQEKNKRQIAKGE